MVRGKKPEDGTRTKIYYACKTTTTSTATTATNTGSVEAGRWNGGKTGIQYTGKQILIPEYLLAGNDQALLYRDINSTGTHVELGADADTTTPTISLSAEEWQVEGLPAGVSAASADRCVQIQQNKITAKIDCTLRITLSNNTNKTWDLDTLRLARLTGD